MPAWRSLRPGPMPPASGISSFLSAPLCYGVKVKHCAKRSLGLEWVERADMLDRPAERNQVTNRQLRIELGHGLLDVEIGLAADLHADTHVITQVDELGDAPGETVGAALAGTVDANALGADRQAHRLAHGADVDRRGTDFLATRQTHHALVAIAADQFARQAVVLTDELGDEGVVRRFVEF